MATPMLIANLSRHDDEIPDVAIPVASELDAFIATVELLCGEDIADRDRALEYLERAKRDGEATFLMDSGVEEDPYHYTVWYAADDTQNALGEPRLNFGVGQGDSRREAEEGGEPMWITVEEYVPNERRKAELEALSHEELVARVLLLETVTGRDSAIPR